ncbi:MAG: hypothetical protein ACI96M_002631 [Candidatus Azotimanducaceae bacterium]
MRNWKAAALMARVLVMVTLQGCAVENSVSITRLGSGPIIHSGLDPSIGENIQGPSLIKVPDWVENKLGKYYLYFADHKGPYIRLAYADNLMGPWQIYVPGTLQVAESHFLTEPPEVTEEQAAQIRASFVARGVEVDHDVVLEVTAPHIASPDVHVDHQRQRIVMYYHGLEGVGYQVTRVATSSDGIHFQAGSEVLGKTYWRAFEHGGFSYGLAMPGQMYRSSGPLSGYEKGPLLFNPDMRHSAVLARDNRLYVFWTQVGNVPEHVKLSHIDMSGDWMAWQVEGDQELLRPEHSWEGADAPLIASKRSTAYGLVNQIRDPAIFEEDGRVYLLYAIGGEAGIAIAEVNGL